ncbi:MULTISPECIES: bifunctional diguanylate cyclase/phosphodiesterase [Paenibacillus]|uniref:bifunctional diguanylate cyclase/phosphodiesterase n=1 Tax=Paenibacillus TaxID=44249 RepID=UPI0022B8A2E2|nr:GGDEF domain-containing phosphodiesterase [Paenibacillus caseinilyticus]MCZ8523965.1 EAL domain-containing protein [Paenibacillus caseinilyticus]
MSIRSKLSMVFSVTVAAILIIHNILSYFTVKDLLREDLTHQHEILSKQLSLSIEQAEYAARVVENLVGVQIRAASVAALHALPADYREVSNERLTELSRKVGVSHITLLARTEGDIVGVKSSDPLEINLSTKDWGYWYTALEQLFDKHQVTIAEGQKLANYWSGPAEVSSSDPSHVDKWGYYYDGTTNYIINPYVRDEGIASFRQAVGPDQFIREQLKDSGFTLEITGINPRTFGQPPIYTENNGRKFIELADRAIRFGTYEYKDEGRDLQGVHEAMGTGKQVSFVTQAQSRNVFKSYIPVLDVPDPFVIAIVTDDQMIEEVVQRQLLHDTWLSAVVLVVVAVGSYVLCGYLIRPLNVIVRKVNEIAEGNFETQVRVNRKDELGLLAGRVNAMADSLASYTRELHGKNLEIAHQASHDPLTGMKNRFAFNSEIGHCLAGLRDRGGNVTLVFIDLDRFKEVNDMFGHSLGDRLLTAAAERMEAALGNQGSVYRMGGDEFILLLPGMSSDDASVLMKRMMKVLSMPYLYEGNELLLTPSIGMSSYPQDGDTPDLLVRSADAAMYRSKQGGGNDIQRFSSEMKVEVQRRVQLEIGIRRALERGEFFLLYQPLMDMRTGRIQGHEALMRWTHADLGIIAPAEFIPIAEETGLIVPIGQWAMREACLQNRQWQEEGCAGLGISVNLSARQFQQQNLVADIRTIIHETGIDPGLLTLEITENLAMNKEEFMIARLRALQEIGVRIAIDDFGTGYSSLLYLKKFPVDILKIDRSFVSDMLTDEDDAEIVRTIMAMAHNLKLLVTAEGVETEGQLRYLKELGCDVAQGYLISRPQHPADCIALVKQFNQGQG